MSKGKATLTIVTIGNTLSEEVEIGGLTVLDILSRNHNITTLQTVSGKRLNCIENVCAKSGFWWQFKVNNELILRSVDQYYPKKGDTIKLEYSSV